jgi:hypothetical protein
MLTFIMINARTSAARASLARHRTLHSTPVALKTVTEKVSEMADQVRRRSHFHLARPPTRRVQGKQKGWKRTCFCDRNRREGNADNERKYRYTTSRHPFQVPDICGFLLGSTMKETKGKAEHASNAAGRKVVATPHYTFRRVLTFLDA